MILLIKKTEGPRERARAGGSQLLRAKPALAREASLTQGSSQYYLDPCVSVSSVKPPFA